MRSRCVRYVRATRIAPSRIFFFHLNPQETHRCLPSRIPPLSLSSPLTTLHPPFPPSHSPLTLLSPLIIARACTVIKTGVISQAAGSAYVEFDKTKVMCGVYGPRQGGKSGGAGGASNNEQGRLEVDVKLATFATPGARGKTGQGDAEREFSTLVLRALEGAVIAETFPKTSVDVYATVRGGGKGRRGGTHSFFLFCAFVFHFIFFFSAGGFAFLPESLCHRAPVLVVEPHKPFPPKHKAKRNVTRGECLKNHRLPPSVASRRVSPRRCWKRAVPSSPPPSPPPPPPSRKPASPCATWSPRAQSPASPPLPQRQRQHQRLRCCWIRPRRRRGRRTAG